MPQISPMNWMLMFSFFIYLLLFMKKKILYEKLISFKKYFMK